MAEKRQASSNLNHLNWNQDEVPEERGTFKTASKYEMENRVIKTAKRNLATGSTDVADGGSGAKSVISGISGSGKQASASGGTAFLLQSKIPITTGTVSISTASKDDSSSDDDKCNEYCAKLKCLNQAVSDWIKMHVDKTPLCILTPIFRDYENYLKEYEEQLAKAEMSNTDTDSLTFSEANTKATTASTPTNLSTFSFSSSTATATSNANSLSKPMGFSFGLKKPDESKPMAASANISFGQNSSSLPVSSTLTTGFSFGPQPCSATKTFSFTPGAAPFSFANIKTPESPAATEKANDEADHDAPINEFRQVVEEGAVYSKKCKVFVKKDGSYVDKGVGTLYLKPIESNGKTQLLVRANTNLGNILVNLILSSGMASQRMGKNNVLLVCGPTPILLRVKTGEEADNLIENIEKYKH